MGEIGAVVVRARGRLSRLGAVAFVARHWPTVAASFGASAALRGFVWPLGEALATRAPVRALIVGGSGAVFAVAVLVVLAYRRRPSLLGAARSLDAALGVEEVVASGFAFERDARKEPMTEVAKLRAVEATTGVDLKTLLAWAPPRPMPRRVRAVAMGVAVLGLVAGALDPALIERWRHPVTASEVNAAGEVERAAAAARAATAKEADPSAKENKTAAALAEAARRAAAAARRGDRKRSLEALDELRAAARALAAQRSSSEKALRDLREELDPRREHDPMHAREGRPSASASEAARKMLSDLSSPSGGAESVRKMAERLARAERGARAGREAAAAEAGKSGAQDPRWTRMEEALREAREAAERGDREGAKRALERAEREMSSLEGEARSEGARAERRLLREASALDRSLRSGMRGERAPGPRDGEADDGDGDGEGDGKKPGDRGGRGKAQARRDPGAGGAEGPGGEGDRTPGADSRTVHVGDSLQARGEIREGERAISAMQGVGKGGDPRPYREIFPSYDSAVEDGLREDLVPAARRAVVRRYFSLIRPGDEPETEKP